VQSDKYINQKLKHRTKEELSSFRILKNLNETCKELKNNPSQKAFEQRVMIVASVNCPRYGVPQIHETQEVIEAAKKLKKEFATGNQTNLTTKPWKKKEVYPKAVFDLAKESWEIGATVVEPAQDQTKQSMMEKKQFPTVCRY
jgi:tyrosyl-tRNA synthetase